MSEFLQPEKESSPRQQNTQLQMLYGLLPDSLYTPEENALSRKYMMNMFDGDVKRRLQELEVLREGERKKRTHSDVRDGLNGRVAGLLYRSLLTPSGIAYALFDYNQLSIEGITRGTNDDQPTALEAYTNIFKQEDTNSGGPFDATIKNKDAKWRTELETYTEIFQWDDAASGGPFDVKTILSVETALFRRADKQAQYYREIAHEDYTEEDIEDLGYLGELAIDDNKKAVEQREYLLRMYEWRNDFTQRYNVDPWK